MAFEDILDRHHSCNVVIIPRFHKGKPRLVHGLYCQNHCKLIKWLSQEQSQELSSLGVEVLEAISVDKLALARQQIKFVK